MRHEEALQILSKHRKRLEEFSVKSISLFGSMARDTLREDSDIDILVEFSRPVGLFEFVRLQRHLEQLLGRPVDLVTLDALKPELRERILKEAIRA